MVGKKPIPCPRLSRGFLLINWRSQVYEFSYEKVFVVLQTLSGRTYFRNDQCFCGGWHYARVSLTDPLYYKNGPGGGSAKCTSSNLPHGRVDADAHPGPYRMQ